MSGAGGPAAGAAGPPAIGVDVGGTKVAAGVITPSGQVLDTASRPTPASSARGIEDAVVGVVEELAARSGPPAGVGVGAAGWFDRSGEVVLFAPHLALRDEPLRARLAGRLGEPLWVGNDAEAAVWAEHRFGAARGAELAVMVTLGTGIGGGIVHGGRLLRGAHGVAGEWGHARVVPDGRPCPCGNRGCWEQYASGTALAASARAAVARAPAAAAALLERAGGAPERLTGEHVADAAAAGDALATRLITDVGTWLGQGLADLAAVLDPDVVVVGGGMSRLGELLLGPARARLRQSLPGRGFRPAPKVVLAALGPAAGLVGAADLARPEGERRRL